LPLRVLLFVPVLRMRTAFDVGPFRSLSPPTPLPGRALD
jgi:hypothetical protein